jgi:hypothetical protein
VDIFRESHPANIVCSVDQVGVLGDVSWNSGAWSCTVEGENGPVPISGYRLDVLVRQGDDWKECVSCYNVTPESTAPRVAIGRLLDFPESLPIEASFLELQRGRETSERF